MKNSPRKQTKKSTKKRKMPSPPLYSKLEHRRDIRLLRIKSKRGKFINVSLEVTNLDSNVPYTALSYVWGESDPPSWIICNGHKVSITYNLFKLLSQLQQQQEDDRLLWADAICINQQDNAEKSIQVNMMRDIYKQAANVIFWLGPQEQHDKAAVRLMHVFAKNHKLYSDLEPLRAKSLRELGLPLFDRGWVGWASLLSRPWFGRIWIVQEFLNATQSTFLSGALAIPSDILVWFALATRACATIGAVVAKCHAGIRNDRDVILSRSYALGLDKQVRVIEMEQEQEHDTRIFDLWTRSQLLGATDPRDRVFALLSTQTAVSMDMIDYEKDEATVYREIAGMALTIPVAKTNWYRTTPSNLDPSPFAKDKEITSRFLACKTETPQSSSLPSWVPDWRPAGFRFVPLTRYFPGTAWFTHEYSHASFQNNVLFISGCIVDHLSIIEDSVPFTEAHLQARQENSRKARSRVKKMLKWQVRCYSLARNLYLPWAENIFLSAFCRTMAFNALANRSKTPVKEYIAGFKALHESLLCQIPKPAEYLLPLPQVDTSSREVIIYQSVFQELSAGRKFAVTAKGDMAWVPQTAKLSDSICFLAGCAVPFVVRAIGDSFELLGDCYLHSMMSDESVTIRIKPRLFEFR